MARTRLPRGYFNARATVYAEDPVTTLRNVPVRANLPCRLDHVSTENAGPARDELLRRRILRWPTDYEMPPFCEIEVEQYDPKGALVSRTRWAPMVGTFGLFTTPEGAGIYRRADVTEQTTYEGIV